MKDDNSQRRGFLKKALAAVALVALAKASNKALPPAESKKMKMLTPDGKLVEVDASVISKATSTQQRASNKEVQQWMKTSKI